MHICYIAPYRWGLDQTRSKLNKQIEKTHCSKNNRVAERKKQNWKKKKKFKCNGLKKLKVVFGLDIIIVLFR